LFRRFRMLSTESSPRRRLGTSTRELHGASLCLICRLLAMEVIIVASVGDARGHRLCDLRDKLRVFGPRRIQPSIVDGRTRQPLCEGPSSLALSIFSPPTGPRLAVWRL